MNQQPSHTTGRGHKEILWLITVLTISLVTVGVILGVHWGRQGFQIAGITVIRKPSLQKFCPNGTVACGIGTAVTHTLNRTTNTTPSGQSSRSEMYGPYRGIVDIAHDGDTVNVKLDLGFDLTVYARVRVMGINAPELSTAAGKRARDFAQAVLPPGTAVVVSSYGWDKYGGRIDGVIGISPYTYKGIEYEDFAHLMLASGNAVPYNP